MVENIRKNRWKIILTGITFLALALLGFGIREQLVVTFKNLARVNAWALLFIPILQVVNYHSQTKLYQSFFHILRTRIPYKYMYRTALELNFVNLVFPSGGVSGFSYISLRLKERGIAASKATIVQMMRFVMIFVSFQIVLFIGLMMLTVGGQANRFMLLVAGSLSTLLLVLTITIGFVIGSKKRIDAFFTIVTRVINRVIHFFRRRSRETINIKRAREVFAEFHENYQYIKSDYSRLKKPLSYSLMANAVEVAVIYMVFIAFGELVNPGAVIIAYAVANFAGLISILPGGVGVYEALMTAILAAAGVPVELSLPVIVMYRILNMSIQLIPGYVLYQKTLHRRAKSEED